MKLIFYTKKLVPRIEYIVNHLFKGISGYQIEFTNDINQFLASDKVRIQYGDQRIEADSFYIPLHPFILERDIKFQTFDIQVFDQLPAFFILKEVKADLPFDFLSMAFYLISRYEEYLPHKTDEHGRYTAHQSLAFQHNFLHQPLVDQWLAFINGQLVERFHISDVKSNSYTFIPTIDVDFAWSYLHKSAWRTIGGFAKDLLSGQIKNVTTRLAVLRGQQRDPYFQFDFLYKLHQSNNCKAIYFLLFGEYGTYDKNSSPRHPAMHQLVQRLSAQSEIGIHPSYASNFDDNQLAKEKNDLSLIGKQTISQSRQHFLKLSFPTTYRRLLSIDIRSDYSMGYAEDFGFRASTSHPFLWYDLENETATELKVYPFQIMDVTLKNYLGLSPDTALEACKKIIEEVRAVDGTLVSIWHNSSFSPQMGWEGWKSMYQQFVELASEGVRFKADSRR